MDPGSFWDRRGTPNFWKCFSLQKEAKKGSSPLAHKCRYRRTAPQVWFCSAPALQSIRALRHKRENGSGLIRLQFASWANNFPALILIQWKTLKKKRWQCFLACGRQQGRIYIAGLSGTTLEVHQEKNYFFQNELGLFDWFWLSIFWKSCWWNCLELDFQFAAIPFCSQESGL